MLLLGKWQLCKVIVWLTIALSMMPTVPNPYINWILLWFNVVKAKVAVSDIDVDGFDALTCHHVAE